MFIECLSKKIHTHAPFIKINSWWHFNSYLCLLLRLFNSSREKENDDGRKKGSVTGCVLYNKYCHRVV